MSDEIDSAFGKLFTSGSVIFLGLVFNFGLGFGGRLLIARLLGKVDYGAVSLGVTLMMAVSTLTIVGTDNGIGRFLPRYDEIRRRRGVLLSAYQIVIPLSVVAGAVVFLFADMIATRAFNDSAVTPVLRVFGLIIPLASFVRLTIGGIRGMQESLPRVYIRNIALPVVRFGLIAVAIAAGLGSTGIAWAYAGSYGVASALSVYYLVRRTPLFKQADAAPMRRSLLVFSAPLMITAAMNLVLSNLDTFMLGYFTTTGVVGVYNVAYPLANLLVIFLTAFNFVFMPMMSEFHADGRHNDIVRTYQIVSKWIFLLTLPVLLVFAFYPELVISTTFGPTYVEGSSALTVLTIGFFFHTVAGPNGNLLMSIGQSRLIMYDSLLVAVANLVLNLILIPRYSLLGAAIATTAAYVLQNGIYLFQLYREIGAHPFRASLFRPALAAVALWGILYVTSTSLLPVTPLIFLGIVVLFGPLYVVIVLRFGGIESEEVALFERAEQKVGVDLTPLRKIVRRLAD